MISPSRWRHGKLIATATAVTLATFLPMTGAHAAVVPAATTTVASAQLAPAATPLYDKVWVCKYSAKPSYGEKAQTVKSVAWQPGYDPGGSFTDAQGLSLILTWDTGQNKPTTGDCPTYTALPPAPTVNDPCGLNNATWNVPADTSTLRWYVDSSGHLWVESKLGPNGYPLVIFPDGTRHDYGLPTDSGALCVAAVPAAPTQTVVCGTTDNDTVAVPADTAEMAYTSSGWVNGTWTVTVATKPGYVLPAGATTKWTFTDAHTPCVAAMPAAPTWTEVCGLTDNDTVTVPADTAEVAYTSSGWVKGTWTITVAAKPGFVLPADATATWTFTDKHTPCVAAMPAAPTWTEVCGLTDNDTVTVPADTAEVAYTSSGWVNGTWTVTVAAKPGYVLPAGATTTWTFTDKHAPCAITTAPAAPTVTDKCGVADNDEVVLPSDTDQYSYASTGWVDGKLVVTATAKDGWSFPADMTHVWTFTDAHTPCVAAMPAAPTWTEVCGLTDNDTVTVPANTAEYAYTSSGWVNGTWTVTVAAKPGYALPAGATTTWTFTDKHTACSAAMPAAPTWTEVCGATDNDTVTVPADTTEYAYTSSGWVNGTWTVTVAAKAGY
jgi:hypothetical protein